MVKQYFVDNFSTPGRYGKIFAWGWESSDSSKILRKTQVFIQKTGVYIENSSGRA